MTDVRSLLKSERAARRIQHKHASYSTGSLLCVICRLQLKSESLWEGHLRSPGHIMRLQKFEQSNVDPIDTAAGHTSNETNKKKRKASDDEDTIRKRNKPENDLPEGFFDPGQEVPEVRSVLPSPSTEIQIPSRPATPSKPSQEIIPKRPQVDENEWAAFEADIAAAEEPIVDNDAVISAPAMTAAELATKSLEESNTQRKERREAEIEGDKEDAARKMEEELEEMESLEQRVRRLRERREQLRKKESMIELKPAPTLPEPVNPINEEEEDDEDDDDDDWDGFRMR